MRNFFARFNIQQSWVIGLLVTGVLGLIALGLVSFFAKLFNTDLVAATGWVVAGAAYVLLLGVGLGSEAWIKSSGNEPPSWLPKANRIMIGGTLVMALSIVLWQFLWGWGASGSHSQGIWMVGSSILVMGLVLAFGLGAMALGQKMGAEFLPGTALVVVVILNAFVALDVTTRGSYTDQAEEGELFYAYRTPSCGPEESQLIPVPLSAWDLGVYQRKVFDIGILWWNETYYKDRRGRCHAYQLDPMDPTQDAWVQTWNDEAQARQGALQAYTGMMVAGLVAALIGAALFVGWWKGKWSFGEVVFVVCGFLFIAMCLGCGGMLVSDILGLNVQDGAEDAGRAFFGRPPMFYEPFQVEPQSSTRVGSPPGSGTVYICQCGPTHRQVWWEANWHTDFQYSSGQYAMAPQGCGGALNVSEEKVYRVHNKAGDLSPVMKIMAHGQSWTCPDGTVLTAR